MKQTDIQNKFRKKFLNQGVKMTAPETVFFSNDTKIGKNVTIEPYVVFGSKVKIKNNVKINPIQLSWLSEGAYQFSPLTRISVRGSVALPSLAQLAQIRGRAMYHLFNYPLKMLRCEILARHVSLYATHVTCTFRSTWPLLQNQKALADRAHPLPDLMYTSF